MEETPIEDFPEDEVPIEEFPTEDVPKENDVKILEVDVLIEDDCIFFV